MKKIFTLVMACAVALAASAELKQWSYDQVSNNGATTTVKEDGTIDIDFTNEAYVQDYGGEYMINAQNSEWYLTFDLYADDLVGTHGLAAFDEFYTSLLSWDTFDYYYPTAMNCVVTIVDGKYDFNVDMEAGETKFHIHMFAPAPPEGALDYDTKSGDINYEFASPEEVQVIDRHSMGEKDVVVQMISSDETYAAVFRLFLDEADPETIIADGEYPIDHTSASGTVAASTGVGAGNVIMPSYFAVLRGGKISKPYFLTSGTMKVTNSANGMLIEVDSKNSWNVPVKLVGHYSRTSGISDIKVDAPKATKAIENGQVVIVKDGIKYNAAGARIK